MKTYSKPSIQIKEFQLEDMIAASTAYHAVQSIRKQMESNGILAMDEAKYTQWGE